MNNKFIFFSLIFFISNVNAMKRKYNNIIIKTAMRNNIVSFDFLPNDIHNIIIDFCTNNSVAKKLNEATLMINALVRTDKKFNSIINGPQFNDKLIDNLAYKFYCSHETIAQSLGTKQSKKRLGVQRQLKHLCLDYRPFYESIDKRLQRLIAQGVNLEFSYNHISNNISRPKTALMISMSTGYSLHGHTILEALLKHGANVNSSNSHGLNALHLAVEWPIKPYYYKRLLAHPSLIINQQNKWGDNALLHCLTERNSSTITFSLITLLHNFLKAGANPKLANKKGFTALDLVQRLRDERITNVFYEIIQEEQAQK